MTQRIEDDKPWYKQFWPWFLIALPGSVVIASFVTIYLAVTNPVSLVTSDYYREGLSINQYISLDKLAGERGLSAAISFDLEVGELVVDFVDEPQPALTLFLYHPSLAERDQVLTLRHVANGRYLASLSESISGRWYVTLQPSTSPKWRLNGEIQLDQSPQTHLQAKPTSAK